MGLLDDFAERWKQRTDEGQQSGRRAMTAAGAQVNLSNPKLSHTRREEWQKESWSFRDKIPELRFAGEFVASALGRLKVYPAENRPRGEEPVPLERSTKRGQAAGEVGVEQETIDAAVAAVERLNLNQHGASLLGRIAENLEFAGECYLLGERGDAHGDPVETWSIRSVLECQITQGGGRIIDPDTQMQQRELNDRQHELMRLWTPHPAYYERPDSSVHAVLDTLEDMWAVAARGRARNKSRIGAGKVFFLPSEATMARPGGAPISADLPGSFEDGEQDPLMQAIIEYISTPVVDQTDVSSIAPMILRLPAMLNDRPLKDLMGTIDLTSGVDAAELTAQYEALVMRFARGINLAPERVKGIGESTNTWCVDTETEVLSTRGWLKHFEVEVGDTILTLNHETGMSEWQPVRDKFEQHVTDEPMRLMETRMHSSLTTMNHRWPVIAQRGGRNRSHVTGEMVDNRRMLREWRTTETLRMADWIVTSAPSADLPAMAKYDDDFVELMAWFWTEGCLSGSVSIAQSHTANPQRVDRIRACLTRLYGPATSDRLNPKVAAWREYVTFAKGYEHRPVTQFVLSKVASAGLREEAPSKIVRKEFVQSLTPAQLELFLDISAQADGWHYSQDGRLDMFQKNEQALEPYELALILSGRTVTRSTAPLYTGPPEARVPNGYGHSVGVSKASKTCPKFAARLKHRANVEDISYTGIVWCPTTDNRSWFARRAGKMYFTGNSANVITADEVKNAVEPRAERICDSLTAAYLQRMLRAMGISPDQRRKVCLWFDSSELVQNPNRAEDAKAAHTAGAMSDSSLLRHLGFTADDAPDNLEMLRRAVDRERLSPASVPILVKVLTGNMPTQAELDALNPKPEPGPGRPIIEHGTAPGLPRKPAKPAAVNAPPPVGERLQPATASQPGALGASGAKRKGPKDDPQGPSVAGIALMDSETGRVLMLQRGIDDDRDPAAGKWEFPGGHVEDGDESSFDAGRREWAEEVGRPFPDGGHILHTWTSGEGIYQGHLVVLPGAEQLVDLDGKRTVKNADDDYSEQSAWWDLEVARSSKKALRDEVVAGTPWKALRKAAESLRSPVVAAAIAAAGRDQSGKFAGAESARQWRLDRKAGRKLTEIDRALVDRILALAEGSVGRAVEKAANRIRSDALKTNKRGDEFRDPLVAAAFPKGTDPRTVLASGGSSLARLSDAGQVDALITAAVDDLEPQFLAEVTRAAEAADEVLDGLLASGVTAAAPRSMLVERVKRNAAAAWRWLSARLRDHARRVLYGGYTPSRDGEASPGIVPASLVRGAVAQAGGLSERSAGVRDDGTSAGEPLGGVATGEVALDKLRVSGAVILAREWQYPAIPRQGFLPHKRLDGVVFEEWTDPQLKVADGDGWLGTEFYHPLDHSGCLCTWAPIAVIGMTEDADPNGDEVAELRRKVLS